MAAISVFFGEKEDWKNSQKQMNNARAFIAKIQKYDVDNVSLKVWKKVRQAYIMDSSL